VIKDHSAEPRPRIPRVPGNDVQDHLQLNKELRQQHSPQMQEYRTILEHQMEEAAHNRIDQLESDSLFKPYNLASHRRRSEHTAPVGTTDRIIDGGRVQEHYEQLTAVQSTLADRMPYGRIIRNQPKAPTAEEQDRRLQKQRERQQILDQLRRDRETLQQRLNEEEQTITAQGPPKILPNGQYTRKPFYGLKTGEIVDVDDNVRSLRRQQLEEYARELRQAHQNQLCREQEQRESEHRVDTETAHADHWKWNKDRLDRTQPRAPLDKELFIGLTPVKTLDSKEAQALADTLKRQDAEIKGRRQTVVEQEIQEELKHLDNHLDLRMKQRDQEDKKRSKALRTMENDRWTVDNSPHRSKTDHVASLLPRND
jgi:hypothetical protein